MKIWVLTRKIGDEDTEILGAGPEHSELHFKLIQDVGRTMVREAKKLNRDQSVDVRMTNLSEDYYPGFTAQLTVTTSIIKKAENEEGEEVEIKSREYRFTEWNLREKEIY